MAALAAALLLLAPGGLSAGEAVRDQKLFMRPSGPRAGVFGRRKVVAFDAAGKPGATLVLEADAAEGALSLDGSRLALCLLNGGLLLVDLDAAKAETVEAKELCGNLAWSDDGSLHYTVHRFVVGAKEPLIAVDVRRLPSGSHKPAVAATVDFGIPPPVMPPPPPVLPGMPPGAGAGPAAAPAAPPVPPKNKKKP